MVLITGGTGFIGSHVAVDLIDRGHQVILIDNYCNSSPEIINRIWQITGVAPISIEGDMREETLLGRVFHTYKNIDCVIHCAGLKSVSESSKSPLDYFDNNVRSTISLLKIMAEVGVKKIIFSSSATIYNTNCASPFDESSPKLATTPYGQSKLIIEDLLENICRSDDEWKVVILRYFNPIGAHPSGLIGECPRGIPNNLFPFILKVASGQLEKLCVFGNDYPTPDGTGTRDYIHVCDLAAGHAQSLALLSNRSISGQPATYNLGTGSPLSVLELLKIFENTNNVSIPFEIGPRRHGDSPIVYSNPKRALRDLAWSATRTPQDMCRDGWAWQKKQSILNF